MEFENGICNSLEEHGCVDINGKFMYGEPRIESLI